MRVSREARVLLALVFVAAAAWVWINYFSQTGDASSSSPVATSRLSASSAPTAFAADEAVGGSSAENTTAENTSTENTTDALTDTPSPFGTVPATETAATGTVSTNAVATDAVSTNAVATGATPAGEVSAVGADVVGIATASVDTVAVDALGTGAGGADAEGTVESDFVGSSSAENASVESSFTESSSAENSAPSDGAVVAALAPEVAQTLPTVQSEVVIESDTAESAAVSSVGTDVADTDVADTDVAGTDGAVDGFAVTAEPAVAPAALEPLSVAPLQVAPLQVAPLQNEPLGTGSAEPLGTVATPQPSTAREVEVAELPFLVTEPPTAETEDAAALDLALDRPNGGLRATVNPFSPILLAPPPDAPQQALQPAPGGATEFGLAPPTTPSGIVDVPIPNAPPGTASADALPARVVAPAPQPLTPQTNVAASLPRPLPGGTLPVTPDLLRTTRNASAAATEAAADTGPGVTDYATVAALRVPDEAERLTFSEAAPPELRAQTEQSEATPLPLVGLAGRGPAMGNPIAAGASSLTRYLRDSNYRFTGYVLSAVGVGMFRSNESAAPVVVTLGQTVPGTDIVLTSLKGEQAELTLGDEKQVLILNPGR